MIKISILSGIKYYKLIKMSYQGRLLKKCPVCLTKINQSTFLIFSIAKCNHIICNICLTKILEKNKECPLCKKNINFLELRKII